MHTDGQTKQSSQALYVTYANMPKISDTIPLFPLYGFKCAQ